MSKQSEKESERQEAETHLRDLVTEHSTIYGQFITVNSIGSVRVYVYYVVSSGILYPITQSIAIACNLRYRVSENDMNGIDVGSDDGSNAVRHLARLLFGSDKALNYHRFG